MIFPPRGAAAALASAIFSVLLLPSCGYYFKHIGQDEDGAVQRASGTPGFAEIKNAIFEPRCLFCHLQYSTYAAVHNERGAILAAVNSGRMPKGGPSLSELQTKLLGDWIAAGAPEFPGAPVPAPVLLTPDWVSVSANILGPRCLVCHNPNGQAKFLDLSTRAAIFASRGRLFGEGAGQTLIDFERPESSYLLAVIQDDSEPMPPVWSNIRRLNPEEILVLTDWIRLGLP